MGIFRKAVGGKRALGRNLFQNSKNVKVIQHFHNLPITKKYFDDKINRVRKEIADDLNNKIAAEKNDVKSHITNEITEVKKILHSTTTIATSTPTTTAEEQVVLISGGFWSSRGLTGKRLTSTEVYPKTCTTPSLPEPTSNHVLFMTVGTKPVVASCGGHQSTLTDSCVVWDSDKQRWDERMMSPLPEKRGYHSVVTLENIGVYIIGGYGNGGYGIKNSKYTSDFLPANNLLWTRGPGLPKDVASSKRGCAVPVSAASFIYINKRAIREYKIYDIAKPTSSQGWVDRNRWPAFSTSNWLGCARTGSYVLIADKVGARTSTTILDIATRKTRPGGNMVTTRRLFHLASVTTGGLTKTFALGGFDGRRYISSVEEWDEDSLNWKPAGNLKQVKGVFAATTVPLSVVCPGTG